MNRKIKFKYFIYICNLICFIKWGVEVEEEGVDHPQIITTIILLFHQKLRIIFKKI